MTDEEHLELMKAQLISAIEAWSEEHWRAGWMANIEVDLWNSGGVWMVLGEAIGWWPTRSKETNYDVVWVPIAEWRAAHPPMLGQMVDTVEALYELRIGINARIRDLETRIKEIATS